MPIYTKLPLSVPTYTQLIKTPKCPRTTNYSSHAQDRKKWNFIDRENTKFRRLRESNNITMDARNDYYGGQLREQGVRGSLQWSDEKDPPYVKRKKSLEDENRAQWYPKGIAQKKTTFVSNENRKQELPKVKLSPTKLNFYKYYRFRQFDKLFLQSKSISRRNMNDSDTQ